MSKVKKVHWPSNGYSYLCPYSEFGVKCFHGRCCSVIVVMACDDDLCVEMRLSAHTTTTPESFIFLVHADLGDPHPLLDVPTDFTVIHNTGQTSGLAVEDDLTTVLSHTSGLNSERRASSLSSKENVRIHFLFFTRVLLVRSCWLRLGTKTSSCLPCSTDYVSLALFHAKRLQYRYHSLSNSHAGFGLDKSFVLEGPCA